MATPIKEKPKITQLRRKKGLGNIVYSKSGDTLNIKLFSQEVKDRDKEGVLQGDYNGTTFPGAREWLSPVWIKIKNEWAWGGDSNDLIDLIKKMRLRYPKDHERAGQFILPGEKVEERLTYIADEVFTHPDLYGTYFLLDGKINLNHDDPKAKFLMLCQKGNKNLVQDKSSDKPENKYLAAGAKYELVSPKAQQKKRKEEVDKDVKALMLLAGLRGDENRLRATAEILEVPGYGEDTDADGIFIMLNDTIVTNKDTARKYGGKITQNRFIEVAEMTNEELDVCQNVMKAIRIGVIRKREKYILTNGAKIDGLADTLGILNYYLNIVNQKAYEDLLDAIDNKKLL